MANEFFEDLRAKIDLLENEKDKEKMKDLIINIIVELEKHCHKPEVNIHMVLHDARQRCKEEIKKDY